MRKWNENNVNDWNAKSVKKFKEEEKKNDIKKKLWYDINYF